MPSASYETLIYEENDLQYESYLQEIAGATIDHVEAVKAFFEKRKPTFKGK